MLKQIVILLVVAFGISGCANQRDDVVAQGGVTCIKPPPEIFTTAIEAQLNASTPKLGEIAKANLTANQKVEKLRETLPEVQSFEVLEYRFCRMYANGLIDKPTYNDMVKQVLPQFSKKQPTEVPKPVPEASTPKPPQYKTCRLLDFGQEGWQRTEDYTDSSSWVGGGHDQTWWCNQVANSFIQARSHWTAAPS